MTTKHKLPLDTSAIDRNEILVDAINQLCRFRAAEILNIAYGETSQATKCAETAREAMQSIKRILDLMDEERLEAIVTNSPTMQDTQNGGMM